MKTPNIYRQGDVLLVQRDRMPPRLVEAPRDKHDRVVLAHGERTGHAHAFRGAGVTAFYKETAEADAMSLDATGFRTPDTILVGGAGATLSHEHVSGAMAEHSPLNLEPGHYDVLVPVEWSDEDEPLRVAD